MTEEEKSTTPIPPSVDPALIGKLMGLLGDSGKSTSESAAETATPTSLPSGLGSVLSNPELMAKLPQIMEMLKPTIQSAPSDAAATSEALPVAAPNPIAPPHSHRDHLLLALKPFLSPERAATIDMLLRLERLESVLRTLK